LHTGNAAPPPDGIIGLRTWSPATYNSAPEGPDDASNALFFLYCGFGPACGGSGDTAATGFRAPFHKSVSQLSILTTARTMIDQGTYRSSACPYECTRRTIRHEVVKSNEANMLSGLGLIGEGFAYPGHADSNSGFSRFQGSGSTEGLLHPLHMSHNVTMDECDAIVERHQLLAPHGVWMVNQEHQDGFASAERLGDCGLFLGARSSVDADLWRAFYRYARMVLRLGHVDTWLDDDIVDAIVHSSAETACNSATSKVCLWWSEFDLDDEEYSCRPKRDASNIVTPSILLATLAENRVAYPPPSPPPPTPPSSPPAPSPPPGAIRCELSGIATTSGYKVPAYDTGLGRHVPVQQKCWRWDPGNDWPPFVAHRDLYRPRDRCAGGRSRDVQWEGGFKQSLITKGTFDPLYQNNDDCPYKAHQDSDTYARLIGRMQDGANCADGGDATQTYEANRDDAICDLGTNLQSCGVRKNLVVFGYANLLRYRAPIAQVSTTHGASNPYYEVFNGQGRALYGTCIAKGGTDDGKWIMPMTSDARYGEHYPGADCHDGGPGSVDDICYYGTDAACGRRRFAFLFDDAGPDVPDDSCGRVNGECEDGLMWSMYSPGKNPCAPNTDRTDCGYRPAKRFARVGKTAEKDYCKVTAYAFNPTSSDATPDAEAEIAPQCSDFSDDLLHGHDLQMREPGTEDQCGRGTQTHVCRAAAGDAVTSRLVSGTKLLHRQDFGKNAAGDEGTLARASYKYHDKDTYINPNLAAQGLCTSPTNLARIGNNLVRPRLFHTDLSAWNARQGEERDVPGAPISAVDMVSEWTRWFPLSGQPASASLEESLLNWPRHVCSDGGEDSVRIPFAFGPATADATASTKFFYDFGCPYGSQPGVCPDREGLEQYHKVMDELDQPSGPAFPNCFDADVPDYECCHAVTEFRIHGGSGVVGNSGSEDLPFCALEDFSEDPDEQNERAYKHYEGQTACGQPCGTVQKKGLVRPVPESDLSWEQFGYTLTTCMARCDHFEGYPHSVLGGYDNSGGIKRCHSFNFERSLGRCIVFSEDLATYDGNADLLYTHTGNQATALYTYWKQGDLYAAYDSDSAAEDHVSAEYRWSELPDKMTGEGGECPVHWTSYHHTHTGCKAFCRAAFQRNGDDDTCMPGKPECANWLDAGDFPTEQYVTVDAECICGAKLEEFQESGKYVHTGTVLQGTRARERALHEDDGVRDGQWEWPDATSQGIDQFHGET